MQKKVSFTVEHMLTEEDILDILTTAIEGGIGYWACLDNTDPDWIEARNQWKEEHKDSDDPIPCFCDVAYRVMQNGKAVKLIDEIDHNTVHDLTMEKFLHGCKVYSEWTGCDLHKYIDDCNLDAEDADCLIQCALFGDVIYG